MISRKVCYIVRNIQCDIQSPKKLCFVFMSNFSSLVAGPNIPREILLLEVLQALLIRNINMIHLSHLQSLA